MTHRYSIAILAGGLGTRLGVLTESTPKALIDINGEPFLAHQLRLLKSNGFEHVVLCVGHLAHAIRDYAGNGKRFDLRIDYSSDGPVPLGTGGAIRAALPLLGLRFFVIYGDSYLTCNFGSVQQSFESSGRLALMTVYRNEGRWDSSNVEFEDGRILAYDKRNRTPRMHHIDYGLGVFHASAFNNRSGGEPDDLADVYADLLRRGELAAVEVSERFYEVGSHQGIREISEYLSRS